MTKAIIALSTATSSGRRSRVATPNGYYDFMSTKFRLNVALGQRLTFWDSR